MTIYEISLWVVGVIIVLGVVQILTTTAYQKGLADGYEKAADMLEAAKKAAGSITVTRSL